MLKAGSIVALEEEPMVVVHWIVMVQPVLELGSRTAASEGSSCWSGAEAEVALEQADGSPKVVVVEIDFEEVPGGGQGPGART